MSTATVVPAPNSSSLLRHVPRLTAHARTLLTAMNLHFAGVAALGIIDLYLIVHLIFVGQALRARNADALDQQRITLRAADLASRPMRGLDTKLDESTTEADRFYSTRLPYAYSQMLTELGVLTKRAGVRLTRGQYPENPVLSGPYELGEVHLDVSISGDYRPVVQFINSVERDKMFFVINGINLTGAQTGQVNLRMRLTTYLRQPTLDESTTPLPAPPPDTTTAPTGGAQ